MRKLSHNVACVILPALFLFWNSVSLAQKSDFYVSVGGSGSLLFKSNFYNSSITPALGFQNCWRINASPWGIGTGLFLSSYGVNGVDPFYFKYNNFDLNAPVKIQYTIGKILSFYGGFNLSSTLFNRESKRDTSTGTGYSNYFELQPPSILPGVCVGAKLDLNARAALQINYNIPFSTNGSSIIYNLNKPVTVPYKRDNFQLSLLFRLSAPPNSDPDAKINTAIISGLKNSALILVADSTTADFNSVLNLFRTHFGFCKVLVVSEERYFNYVKNSIQVTAFPVSEEAKRQELSELRNFLFCKFSVDSKSKKIKSYQLLDEFGNELPVTFPKFATISDPVNPQWIEDMNFRLDKLFVKNAGKNPN